MTVYVAAGVAAVFVLVVALIGLCLCRRRAKATRASGLDVNDVWPSKESQQLDVADAQADSRLDPDHHCAAGDAKPDGTATSRPLSSTGRAALERARSHRQESPGKSGVRVTRKNSWGRLAMRSAPAVVTRPEPAVKYESSTAASKPTSDAHGSDANGQQLTVQEDAAVVDGAKGGEPVPTVAAVASLSECISSPSGSSRGETPSPPEGAPAPASEEMVVRDMAALRERINAHKLAAKDGGGRLSCSSGALPTYTSIGMDSARALAHLVPVAEQGAESPKRLDSSVSLRKCSSCDSPLSPRSPRLEVPDRAAACLASPPAAMAAAPPAAAAAAPPAGSSKVPPAAVAKAPAAEQLPSDARQRAQEVEGAPAPDAGGISQAADGREGANAKPRRVKPLLVDGRPPLQTVEAPAAFGTGSLQLPRRSLDAQWPPDGGGVSARSGIRPESLLVDRI